MKKIVLTLALTLFLINPSKSSATDFLFVSNFGNHSISRFDLDGNYISSITTNLYQPEGLAINSSGYLYAANYRIGSLGGRAISKFNANGQFASYIFSNTNLNLPSALVFDSIGNLYAANTNDNTVSKFDPAGNFLSKISTDILTPAGLAFDLAGNLLVSNSDPLNGGFKISKFDNNGNFLTYYTASLNSPAGIATDSSGYIYVANAGNNTISKLDTNGNLVSTINSDLNTPWGLTLDSSGNLYAVNTGNGTISKFSPTGAFIKSINTNMNNPQYVVVGVPEPSSIILIFITLITFLLKLYYSEQSRRFKLLSPGLD